MLQRCGLNVILNATDMLHERVALLGVSVNEKRSSPIQGLPLCQTLTSNKATYIAR